MLTSGRERTTRENRRAKSSYTHLMTLLAQGWQIELPIYARPRWQSLASSKREDTYHFVLRQGDRFSLISVFDCPEVQQFLEDEQLMIDRL